MMAVKVMGRVEREHRKPALPLLPVLRSTGHPGSKPWFTHLTQPARHSRVPSPAEGQKAIPPQFRTGRTPLPPVVPMSAQERWLSYTLNGTRERRTGPQARRFRHKHGPRMANLYLGHTYRGQRVTIVADEISTLL